MTGFRHVGIVVSDMRLALRFYVNYLGLSVVRQFERRGGPYMSILTALPDVQTEIYILETADRCKVELLQFHSHPAGRGSQAKNSDVGRSHVALTVADLRGLYARRDEYDVKFQTEPLDSPDGVLVCFCHDPDGTLVELVEPVTPRAT